MSWVMFGFGYIAFCFLLYTLVNRRKLNKRNYRIQIISEIIWIVVLVSVGIYLL